MLAIVYESLGLLNTRGNNTSLAICHATGAASFLHQYTCFHHAILVN